MARSLMLIAALAVTSFFNQSAAGQEVRGIPISGAKITFSNSPDGSDPKTSFSSSEYIYGHLDLGGRTMYDAFGWKAMGERQFYYVSYYVKILKPSDDPPGNFGWFQGRTYTLVTKEDAQKTFWNFDVLPDPAKVSTLTGDSKDDLKQYKGVSGMYSELYDVDSTRDSFPKNGTYTIDITIYGDAYDDWGKPAGGYEGAPTVTASFPFQFSGADGPKIGANTEKARENIEMAKNRREMLHAMPDWWARAGTPPDPKLAPARLVPMIKAFLGDLDVTYMKHAVYPSSGPIWVIQKNDLGIPEYRVVKSYIYVIYKDPKDGSCQYGALVMREDYSGGGTYAAPHLSGIRDNQYIDCAVVK